VKATAVRRALLAMAAAIVTVAIGIGVGLVVISFGLGGPLLGEAPAATATPRQSPATATPAPTTLPDLALQMPVGDNCVACHTTPTGGVGTVPVPPIGHPLEGWTSCTSCHANDRLVKTAPGHTGIHADQCLLCHKATTPAGAARPHSLHPEVPCTSCHGTKAPLPASMRDRSGTTCWLCHQGSSAKAPLYLHPTPADGRCLTCHVAGKLGALPADHEGRTNAQCSECHAPAASPAPHAPHDLALREGMCEFCHGTGSPDVGPSPSQ
jgi:hypothetical protein